MRQLTGALPVLQDERILAAFANAEDGAVYRVSDDRALIVSVDFITPLVDDPALFGAIAAANSLSDIYAMGGRGLLSLSVLITTKKTPPEVLTEIARGAGELALSVGAPILGGHTVESDELIFGLAVVGEAHPERIFKNDRLTVGDQLLLTKPVGTGTLTTALKKRKKRPEDIQDALDGMAKPNAAAVEPMHAHGVRAATDITGFGLLGHAAEMANGSGVKVVIEQGAVPLYAGARESMAAGFHTRGNKTNLEYVRQLGPLLGEPDLLVLDPQTSGGLLIAVRAEAADDLATALREAGYGATTRIGEVREGAGVEVR